MSVPAATPKLELHRRRVRQGVTLALLFAGYAGYYLCRSDFSVTLPLLLGVLQRRGVSAANATVGLGTVASLGVLAYALGKFPSGWIADRFGGRRNFLGGMAGAIAFTLLFTLGGGLPLFTLAWIGNRLTQSLGWPGMVKIGSRWFSSASYGTAMGILSVSFLFGDAAAREFLGRLLAAGVGWRPLWWIAAATLGLLLAANFTWLRESPLEVGLDEPAESSALAALSTPFAAESGGSALAGFLRSPVFWLACALSLGTTLLRETFNLWTPTFFTQSVGLSVADAAQKSALFPLFGGASVLLAGCGSDRMGKRGRGWIIVAGMAMTSLLLWAIAADWYGGSKLAPVILVAMTGFVLIGPYSYMAGAMALDFGGKRASATASGILDGIGYLGAVASGNTVATVLVAWGWRGAFAALAAVAVATGVAGVAFLALQNQPRQG